jgi:ribonucleotide reductase alpha subunit
MFNQNFLSTDTTYVTKRNGEKEEVSFDKIIKRIKFLSTGLKVNPIDVSQQIISQIKPDILTSELDLLGADICINMVTNHPDYGVLAARILTSNHHKNTSPSFSECVELLRRNKDKRGKPAPLINDEVYQLVMENKNKINDVINHDRDGRLDYFGFKTLERSYLLKSNGKVIERPQYMWMRVALGIHRNDFKDAIETYDLMSNGYFTHATPTLFNASTCREQLSSCFLLAMRDDSVEGIYDTLKQCALISQTAGGIGLSVHNVRSIGSYIRGTGGTSNGLVPMLRVYNNTARYIDQCFHPNTYVYTRDGLTAISNLVAGKDEVFDINGNLQVVKKVLEHNTNQQRFKLKTTLGETIVTEQHPMYVRDSNKIKYNNKWLGFSIDDDNDAQFNFEWTEVKDIGVGDEIYFPKLSGMEDITELTEDVCRIIAYCFLDANINSWSDYNYHRMTAIVHDRDVKKIKNYLDSNFIQYKCDNNYIQIEKSPNLPFTSSDYIENTGHYPQGLQAKLSSRIMNLPSNKLKIIYDTIQCVVGLEEYSHYSFGKFQKYLNFIRQKVYNEPVIVTSITECNNDNNDNNMLMYDLEFETEHNYLTEVGVAHNGGGKRCGSFAMYLEPHHPDIIDFLEMKQNTGSEEMRARDLFYAVWLSDEFMRRVENNEKWTLLDPDEFPGLHDVYGDEYSRMYRQYENDFNLRYKYNPQELKAKVIKARDIWMKIIEAQVETGTPYIGYKDAVNRKNNQANLGTIRSSNLCIEINLFTSKEEVAVCNLASICLPRFVDVEKQIFDFDKLRHVVKVVVKNLNKVIDVNYYPVPEAERSNLRHRPIGCGIQGLADTFCLLRMGFDSPEAKALNRQIAEHMYLAGVEASMEISKKRTTLIKEFLSLVDETYKDWNSLCVNKATQYYYNIPAIELLLNFDIILFKYKQTINEWQTAEQLAISIGADNSGLNEFDDKKQLLSYMKRIFDLQKILKLIPEELNREKYYGAYSSFIGSPISQGNLQYDLWGINPSDELMEDFQHVKDMIQEYGLRNSTLFAYMPTASTSQIQGNNECFEPYTYNIYTRKVLSGQHKVVNKHLINDLLKIGMWNSKVKDLIIAHSGSIQNINGIPDHIKELYKTVWELSQKTLIDFAADRAPFICQTQSMNLFMSDPTYGKMTSMHFYAWRKGLKTGMYYLRTRTKANAQQFTVDPELLKQNEEQNNNDRINAGSNNNSPAITASTPPDVFVCSRDNPDCEACGA